MAIVKPYREFLVGDPAPTRRDNWRLRPEPRALDFGPPKRTQIEPKALPDRLLIPPPIRRGDAHPALLLTHQTYDKYRRIEH